MLQKKQLSLILYFSSHKNETWKLAETNRVIQEKLHITQNLTGIFLDPKAWKYNQEEKYQSEIAKLWNFISNNEPFEFKTIQDILDDLYQCQTKTANDVVELKERTNDLMGKFKNIHNLMNHINYVQIIWY